MNPNTLHVLVLWWIFHATQYSAFLSLTQTLAKHTIAFQCHNFFDKALCTGTLDRALYEFFSYLSSFYQGTKKGFNAQSYIFHHKKNNITSFSTRVYIFCLSFLHYNVKNVTYFLTIKVFFFVNNGGCVIHAMIYSISLKFLFFLNISCVAPMNREMV